MVISLVQCPSFGIDRPPIALGYLASFVRKHGFIVNVFDFNADLYSMTGQEEKKLWEFKYVFEWVNGGIFSKKDFIPDGYFTNWAKQVLASDPFVIGFSVQSSSLKTSIELANKIKEVAPDKIIIFGGPLNLTHSIEHSYYLLELENGARSKSIDVVILGEGEDILLDAINRIKNKKTLEGCLGTVLKVNNRIVNNGLRPLIKDLDGIPFPEFHGLTNKYKYSGRIPILGSRGCIHKCTFCDDTRMWQYYRFRSAENIIAEMKLRKNEGAIFLEFNDLLINGNLRELHKLCDLLIKERIGISWGGSASVNRDMDLGFLKKLKSAGCRYLNYGIESASPKVLQAMNKGFSIEEAKNVIENTHKAGIAVCTNWIVGFPMESHEDFRMTIDFVKDNISYLKNGLMVNSFILKGNSFIFDDKPKFGIIADASRNWYSQGGLNTVEERKRRYEEFINLISVLKDKPAHETFQG